MTARVAGIVDPYVLLLQVGFKRNDLGAKQRKDTLVPGHFSKLLIHRVIIIVAAPQNLNCLVSSKLNYNIIEYPDSYPADEPPRRCPDITKARRQIGFEPVVDLDDGLKRFLSWTDKTYTGDA